MVGTAGTLAPEGIALLAFFGAERNPAEKSIAFRLDQSRPQIGFVEASSSITQNSALVAYVRYSKHSLQKRGPQRDGSGGSSILRGIQLASRGTNPHLCHWETPAKLNNS